jgi:hypothetical protein
MKKEQQETGRGTEQCLRWKEFTEKEKRLRFSF